MIRLLTVLLLTSCGALDDRPEKEHSPELRQYHYEFLADAARYGLRLKNLDLRIVKMTPLAGTLLGQAVEYESMSGYVWNAIYISNKLSQ